MPNALAREKSPYLLQHADNPVDWMPWGDAAFARARDEQKPIFLSIGYATCHWCHVMAHESFENPAIAELLNAHFIPVKVDREERPDVDRIYMSYVQALTGHGGWPLSAWLTPELKPFYGGTYFPPEDRHGRPGFPAILQAIAAGWKNEREKLTAEAERVLDALKGQSRAGGGDPVAQPGQPDEDRALSALLAESASTAFEKCFETLSGGFDAAQGGFGGAPKFPRAGNLDFLFRCAALQGVGSDSGREAVGMIAHTLQQMARGGIHDHVGGGFHRYSVDAAWFVPHFEKMLYDQALITFNALEAWQATGDERHAWLARDILDYVLRDMTHPGGGFYSAEDADSEPVSYPDSGPAQSAGSESPAEVPQSGTKEGSLPKEPKVPHKSEGAFYIWTQSEIERILGSADAPLFCAHFGVKPEGNVPPGADPHGEFTGANILAQVQPLAATAKGLGLDLENASDRLASCLERLRAARALRPRPQLDDKILTAWNGLMISALARAAVTPAASLADRRADYLAAAVSAATFVQRELFDADRGVLHRSWREGRGRTEGFAEDYAYLIQGLLDLYEATFDVGWIQWAERLQATMDALFWDDAHGGYFNSAAGATDVILRLKEDYDGAEPAPSSVAAMNLMRLDGLVPGATPGRTLPYRLRALRTLAAFLPRWNEAPQALPQMLCAIERALEPPRHLALAGNPLSPDFQALVAVAREELAPRRIFLVLDGGAGQDWLSTRAPWLAGMKPVDGRATAFLCEEFACQAPVTDPADLRKLLYGN